MYYTVLMAALQNINVRYLATVFSLLTNLQTSQKRVTNNFINLFSKGTDKCFVGSGPGSGSGIDGFFEKSNRNRDPQHWS